MRVGDRSMTNWPSYVAAVLSGVLAATLAFYVWGRRVERRASETSQRLVLAAKEKPKAGPQNPPQGLPEKLPRGDPPGHALPKLAPPLADPRPAPPPPPPAHRPPP